MTPLASLPTPPAGLAASVDVQFGCATSAL
jgi:hypothetical protein